jgi:Ca-activated chloride channel family protein
VTFPSKLPDLYAGEPVVLTAEIQPGAHDGLVELSGTRAGRPWNAQLPLDAGSNETGIGVLWARDKIEALMDAKRNGAPADEIKRDVITVALAHHLVSAYTSLVAVDVTPSAPAGVMAKKTALPMNAPAGSAYAAIAGMPQTATPAPLLIMVGALMLLLAAAFQVAKRRTIRADMGRTPSQRMDAIAAAARRIC